MGNKQVVDLLVDIWEKVWGGDKQMQAEEGCQTDLTCQALKVANGHLISPPVSMSIPFSQSLHDSGRSSPIPAASPTLRQFSTKTINLWMAQTAENEGWCIWNASIAFYVRVFSLILVSRNKFQRIEVLITCTNAKLVKWEALSSRHIIVNNIWTKTSPIYQDSTSRPCQEESHQVLTFQDASLGRTLTTPLKNAKSLINMRSCFRCTRELHMLHP